VRIVLLKIDAVHTFVQCIVLNYEEKGSYREIISKVYC
jgi:hypothetical protein